MRERIKDAMVLAAGRGTRMRALTNETPKPMIRVCGKPLIDYVFDHLRAQGVSHIVVNLCYLGEMIRAHCLTRTDARFDFSTEEEALETGGGVKKALPLLNAPYFFVSNSDPLWTNGKERALDRMEKAWDPDTMDALLLLVPKERAYGHDGTGDYFVIDGKPVRKQNPQDEAPYIFAGVQILKTSLFDNSPDGKFRLVPLYDKAQAAGRLACVVHDGEWFHVGTPEALKTAQEKLS